MRASLLILAFAVATPSLSLAAKPAGKDATKVNADKEKLICRREVPIGSLIASRKTCMTALQWQKQAENAEAEAERMNPHLSTEHGH